MEKIDFINNQQPALNATNLNKLQQNVEDAIQEVQDVVDDLDTNKLDKTSVKNTYSTSAVDTYSCNYVNSLETYSTTETRVGTWVDNKPIYRKVIIDTTSRTSGNYNIAHGISNLSDVIHIETLCWQNSTTMFNATSTSPLSGSERTTSYLNDSNITIRNAWECIKIVIIIEYTKTTDV